MNKKSKHIVALEPAEQSYVTPLLERKISLTLEQGGYISLTFSRDNIAGCVAGIIYSVEGGTHSFDPETPISVTFKYWQLDDDLTDLEISAGVCDLMHGAETVVGCCRRLVASAKMKFADALARQQITLKGPIGQLEAA